MTIDDQQQEDKLAAKICSHLDKSATALDDKTMDALSLARQNALAATVVDRPTGKTRGQFMGWASALAAVSVLYVGVLWLNKVNQDASFLQDDFSLVLISEDLDMLEEDIEFYHWLEWQYPDKLVDVEDPDSRT